MTNEKALARKRLILYLFFAFAIAWIPWIILNMTVGFDQWFQGDLAPSFLWLLLISGGGPAIANFLTRIITKEGWENSLLHLRLKGNLRYYLIAVFVPLAAGLLRGLSLTIYAGDFSAGSELNAMQMTATAAAAVSNSLIIAFNTFGEEFGWRGYMNPKMESLLGKPTTVLIGGVIWGIWHAPLTVCGHNFGKDYPGFPWLGIVLMSLFCIGTGCFLMWLTDRSKSIFPASIAHSAINNGSAIISALMVFGVAEDTKPTFPLLLMIFLPMTVIYALFAILLFRKRPVRTASAE